jgi:hypothetical protein
MFISLVKTNLTVTQFSDVLLSYKLTVFAIFRTHRVCKERKLGNKEEAVTFTEEDSENIKCTAWLRSYCCYR